MRKSNNNGSLLNYFPVIFSEFEIYSCVNNLEEKSFAFGNADYISSCSIVKYVFTTCPFIYVIVVIIYTCCKRG